MSGNTGPHPPAKQHRQKNIQMNQVRVLLLCLLCGAADSFAPSSPLTRLDSKSAVSFRKYEPTHFIDVWPTSRSRRTNYLAAAPLEVIDPSYNLALGSLALGAVFGLPGSPLKSKLSAYIAGIPLTLFGFFLAFQTTTLRFSFDENNFSLLRSSGESSGENLVVGGENVWAYDKFVNYDLL